MSAFVWGDNISIWDFSDSHAWLRPLTWFKKHNDDGGEVLSTTNLQCKSVLVLFGFLKAGAVSLDVIFWGEITSTFQRRDHPWSGSRLQQ